MSVLLFEPTREFVPIKFEPIYEVTHPDELTMGLTGVMRSEIPGFVIRNTVDENPPVPKNASPADFLIAVLGRHGYGGFMYNSKSVFELDPKYEGEGDLHEDTSEYAKRDPWYVAAINVHTTSWGAGNVLLAESGPRCRRDLHAYYKEKRQLQNLDYGQYDEPSRADEHIKELKEAFLEGYANPDFIRPIAHYGSFEKGDIVVFPSSNRRGPIWHRFDTTSYLRYSKAVEATRPYSSLQDIKPFLDPARRQEVLTGLRSNLQARATGLLAGLGS